LRTLRDRPLLALIALIALIAVPLSAGCGSGTPVGNAGPPAPTVTTPSVDPPPAAPPQPNHREKLQGTWEIIRYESESVIPDEAMPLMGAMFEALRIQFDGSDAVARIEKHEARVTFSIESATADEFTLVAREWMFDGARCRFTGEGELEIKDRGGRWPGVSRLRRVP
jgi:hypothetical protein